MSIRLCRLRHWCWIPVVFLLISGCSTFDKKAWNARVGTYSFDQAVKDMGPPDKSAPLSDGSRVAEWLMYKGGTYGSSSTMRGSWVQSYYETPSPDTFLRLTFDSQGALQAWKRVSK